MTLLVVSFVLLLIFGMPVAFVIGISGMLFFSATPDLPFSIVVQRIVAQTQSYSFLAVPFFIFAGERTGGLSRLRRQSRKLSGRGRAEWSR